MGLDINHHFYNIRIMEQVLKAQPITGAARAVRALAALAQETRLAIFRLLVEHARDGLTPGAIVLKLKLRRPRFPSISRSWPMPA